MNLYANIAGRNISSYLTNALGLGRLMSLTITDEVSGKSDKVSLTVARDRTMSPPPEESEMIFALPDRYGTLRPMGTYYSDAPKTNGDKRSGHKMSLSGTSANMAGALKEKRTDSYDQTTVKGVVSTIAGRQGLTPVVSSSLGSIEVKHKDQVNVSDMHFLKTWAKEMGAFFKIREGRLLFLENGSATSASGSSLLPVKCIGSEIISYSWTGGKRGKYKSAKAFWHDQASAERKTVETGSGEPVISLNKTFANEAEAKRAAESALKDASVADDKCTVTVPGDAGLRAGGEYVVPAFVYKELTGSWFIAKATHKVDKQGGYETTLDLERKR
ncbi:contractile injection system protein, VgrG/Pvc8 family [uncultured Cohaesibacter sp.]|uniref:phage late control D family protein n=1 Tax=uncultured Cohaesibacter sp. TaxID=1002546 RepID=UPI002AABEABC|nr:contractile injection system protein, VgrG/Pvc8 family [uncultured Cohaesibacter sp.]